MPTEMCGHRILKEKGSIDVKFKYLSRNPVAETEVLPAVFERLTRSWYSEDGGCGVGSVKTSEAACSAAEDEPTKQNLKGSLG